MCSLHGTHTKTRDGVSIRDFNGGCLVSILIESFLTFEHGLSSPCIKYRLSGMSSVDGGGTESSSLDGSCARITSALRCIRMLVRVELPAVASRVCSLQIMGTVDATFIG